uniref:Anaphase-promoting complex subunit 11 n=1 Tax=Globodera rostochiensis TaxID=31243 RepID=A0A914IC29_GLORO
MFQLLLKSKIFICIIISFTLNGHKCNAIKCQKDPIATAKDLLDSAQKAFSASDRQISEELLQNLKLEEINVNLLKTELSNFSNENLNKLTTLFYLGLNEFFTSIKASVGNFGKNKDLASVVGRRRKRANFLDNFKDSRTKIVHSLRNDGTRSNLKSGENFEVKVNGELEQHALDFSVFVETDANRSMIISNQVFLFKPDFSRRYLINLGSFEPQGLWWNRRIFIETEKDSGNYHAFLYAHLDKENSEIQKEFLAYETLAKINDENASNSLSEYRLSIPINLTRFFNNKIIFIELNIYQYEESKYSLDTLKIANATKDMCTICLEPIIESQFIIKLHGENGNKSAHIFHKDCIKSWFDNCIEKLRCPFCNQALKSVMTAVVPPRFESVSGEEPFRPFFPSGQFSFVFKSFSTEKFQGVQGVIWELELGLVLKLRRCCAACYYPASPSPPLKHYTTNTGIQHPPSDRQPCHANGSVKREFGGRTQPQSTFQPCGTSTAFAINHCSSRTSPRSLAKFFCVGDHKESPSPRTFAEQTVRRPLGSPLPIPLSRPLWWPLTNKRFIEHCSAILRSELPHTFAVALETDAFDTHASVVYLAENKKCYLFLGCEFANFTIVLGWSL